MVSGIIEKPESKDAPSNLGVVGRYILSSSIFKHIRNLKPGSGGEYQLTDAIAALLKEESVIAYEYEGESMVFTAPWNEDMIVNKGDFLATTDETIPEVYRIERSAFYQTYKRAVNLNSDDESVILSTN